MKMRMHVIDTTVARKIPQYLPLAKLREAHEYTLAIREQGLVSYVSCTSPGYYDKMVRAVRGTGAIIMGKLGETTLSCRFPSGKAREMIVRSKFYTVTGDRVEQKFVMVDTKR